MVARRFDGLKQPSLAALFHALAHDIADPGWHWEHESHVEDVHHRGRLAASRFYALSPHAGAHELGKVFEVHVGYCETGSRVPYSETLHGAGAIMLRFAVDHPFEHFLSYPFLFMHEYMAHVFSPVRQNVRFTDGSASRCSVAHSVNA